MTHTYDTILLATIILIGLIPFYILFRKIFLSLCTIAASAVEYVKIAQKMEETYRELSE